MTPNSRSYLSHFTQPDTIISEQSQGVQAWDRYAYANNNPIRYDDPSGHGICEFLAGLFGVSVSCGDPLDVRDLIDIFVPVKSDDGGLIVDPPLDENGNIEGFDPVPGDDWGEGYGPYRPGDIGLETFDPVDENNLDALVSRSDKNKSDIEFIKDLMKKYGLDPNDRSLRRPIHDWITGQHLSDDEIETEIAQFAQEKRQKEERIKRDREDGD